MTGEIQLKCFSDLQKMTRVVYKNLSDTLGFKTLTIYAAIFSFLLVRLKIPYIC